MLMMVDIRRPGGPRRQSDKAGKKVRCLRFVDPGLISNGGSLISIPRCVVYRYIYDNDSSPLPPPLLPPTFFFPQATMLPRLVRPTATTFNVLARRSLATSAVLAQVRHSLTLFISLHHHHHHRSPRGPPTHNSSSRKHPCMTFTYSTRPRWSPLLATACP